MNLDPTVVTLLLAALTGGVALRLIEAVVKGIGHLFSTPERKRLRRLEDRELLLGELERLSAEISSLRTEVEILRRDLRKKVVENSNLTGAYYALRSGFLAFLGCVKGQTFYHELPNDHQFLSNVRLAEGIIREADAFIQAGMGTYSDEEGKLNNPTHQIKEQE